MNLLEQKSVFDKTIKKRLTLKGVNEEFDTYRVPIDALRYNVKNDRIATFITQYIDETSDLPEDKEEFNNVIEDFIVQSNPDAFSKTKNNIKALGQIEPAVVMADGVVIDGNRRFTALRQLYKKSGKSKYGYLEAVILPRELYTDKDIKRLELNLQHAIESKVDYNPIERLVGVYRDLVQEGHPFTIEEYAEETQIPVKKVKEEVEIAKLLVEYLNYINQSEKFHIARRQKIDGPLREVHKILKSKKIDENSKDGVKEVLFANILSLDGDITREIRNLKPIMEKTEDREELLEEVEDLLDDISDDLSQEDIIREAAETGIININRDLCKSFSEITDKYVDNEKLSQAKNQPIEVLKKSLERLEKVDKDAVSRFNQILKDEFAVYLQEMETELKILKELLDA